MVTIQRHIILVGKKFKTINPKPASFLKIQNPQPPSNQSKKDKKSKFSPSNQNPNPRKPLQIKTLQNIL